ncbi:MAG: hypothetical protein RIF41_33975 [Polyangiaceae bacterium]
MIPLLSVDVHPGPLLIVDDRADVLRTLGPLFELWFGTVLLASTPVQAAEHVRVASPPFLLCDHDLGPGVPNGCEVVRWLRASFPCLQRVALMTGGSAVSLASDWGGADFVFAKPFDAQTVRRFFLDGR